MWSGGGRKKVKVGKVHKKQERDHSDWVKEHKKQKCRDECITAGYSHY